MKLSSLLQSNKSLGSFGEAIARRYLRERGFKILRNNFRIRYGEIDIIAMDGDTLVFVEVKTRSSDAYGSPEEAVGPHKIREIVHTGLCFVMKERLSHMPSRIDVVAIAFTTGNDRPEIRHHRNVTG